MPGQLMDIGAAAYERRCAGRDVVVFCRGLAVASFRQGDSIGRDVAIATLVRVGAGLRTDTIADLCDASHGGVCEVRRRLAEGGLDRVLERARLGAPRKVVGDKEARLREMHAARASTREIAESLGISKSLVATEIKRLKLAPPAEQQSLLPSPEPSLAAAATNDPMEVPSDVDGIEATVEVLEASVDAGPCSEELVAGAALASGPDEHSCRYAGTLLICAAASAIGVLSALDAARVVRPAEAVYDARQIVVALLAAWGAGHASLESMHDRDARALGAILGLERSPSVRTLHRALAQMSMRHDPIELGASLMRGVLAARLPEQLWFGVDGHFKAYSGKEPIDKGWDSKRRLATKGLSDVFITDAHGFTWSTHAIPAGSGLAQHLGESAHALRSILGCERPIVLAFDRGGFDFDVLDALDRDGFYYVSYIPATVTLPDLVTVAPAEEGVGEIAWVHGRLHHRARLIAERDGKAIIPMVTNLPTLVDAVMLVQQLRTLRGAQENSFKAARSFAHLDRLVDRGGATHAPDDRLVPNPTRAALKNDKQKVAAHLAELASETPSSGARSQKEINHDRFWTEVSAHRIDRSLRAADAKVPRVTIEPDALRAHLKTRHRLLLQPLKLAADNARRWLIGTLGTALAPTDKPHDASAIARTLLALLRAPGSLRFEDHQVTVTLLLPLPPTPHARLAAALVALDHHTLLFTDGRRRLRFRLAPRPTRRDIPRQA
jgi:transposase